jgi:hypothetical protein
MIQMEYEYDVADIERKHSKKTQLKNFLSAIIESASTLVNLLKSIHSLLLLKFYIV